MVNGFQHQARARRAVACPGVVLVASLLGLVLAPHLQDRASDSPTSQPARVQLARDKLGRIEGRVTVQPPGSLPEMIVYLECADPRRRFPAPTTPAVVRQKGARFSPALVVVSVGQRVDFPNDEERPVQHNVFSKSQAKPFDLGLYRPGVSKSVTFDEPGVVRLHCSIHRQMDGVIYVCPTPFFERVGPDGAYVLKDVPAGAYELRTWQRERRYLESSVRVEVQAERPTVVSLELTRN